MHRVGGDSAVWVGVAVALAAGIKVSVSVIMPTCDGLSMGMLITVGATAGVIAGTHVNLLIVGGASIFAFFCSVGDISASAETTGQVNHSSGARGE